LAAEDLVPLVLYIEGPSRLINSGIESTLSMSDNQFHSILVIDDCDQRSRSDIWNRLRNLWPRIKLVTIAPEEWPASGGDVRLAGVPALPDEKIAKIIEGYGVPSYESSRWAELCGGSPRVAHVIGQNLRDNPDDILREPSTAEVWERYIAGFDDRDSPRVRDRRLVLRFLGLFKRFGYEKPVGAEGEAIAKLIEEKDPSISQAHFQEIVKELRERKVFQGDYTLYITPKALHIKLWTEWWDTYGSNFDMAAFEKKLPASLLEAFREMFVYAAQSQTADRVVRQLLGEDGPFKDDGYLRTAAGARFFLALTEGNATYSMQCLQRTLAKWDEKDLQSFTTGRREVVWALERIVVWKGLFVSAAGLLLKLAEAENESVSNNATGVFVGLFDTGPGPIAPTEASPTERLPVLIGALNSASSTQRKIALQACRNAMRIQRPGMRMVGPAHQGVRPTPHMWRPRGRDEVIDYLAQVWELVREQIDSELAEVQAEAVDTLLDGSRDFAQVPELGSRVLETLEWLRENYKMRVLEKTVEILRYEQDRLPAEQKEQWEHFKEVLTGSDFSSLLRRYVGTDLIEDRFDERGERTDAKSKRIEELAEQAADQSSLLQPELSWLTTAQAKDGYSFGMALGIRDMEAVLLPSIVEAQREVRPDSSLLFLGGYLRGIGDRDAEKLEEIIAELFANPETRTWVPDLTWRANLVTDDAAQRVLLLAQEGVIRPNQLRMFVYGAVIQKFSANVVSEWLEFLLASEDPEALGTAADLAHMYHYGNEMPPLPHDLVLRLVLRDEWFVGSKRSRGVSDEYHWEGLVTQVSFGRPEVEVQIGSKILELVGSESTYSGLGHSRVGAFRSKTVVSHPQEMWRTIIKCIEPPLDGRGWEITNWLRGGLFEGGAESVPFDALPIADVLDWVAANPEKRAILAVSISPKRIEDIRKDDSIVRQLLIRYGDREDVRRSLEGSFSTEGWRGPASAHFAEKMRRLENLLKEEQHPRVIEWLRTYVSHLSQQIEYERVREEREF
jgi:hypothetical protein